MKKYDPFSTTLYAIGRAIEVEDDPEVKEQLEDFEEKLTKRIRVFRKGDDLNELAKRLTGEK